MIGAAEALRRMARGDLTSEGLARDLLQRIEDRRDLNAVVAWDPDAVLAEARRCDEERRRGHLRGPLHGLPVTIKDSFETTNLVCTAGTAGRRAFVPERDAAAVTRLKATGAFVLGKTNVPEMCLALETDNDVYGRTSNPHDPTRTCGGSSGGEAAALAAGLSVLGLGSDTGGSIRLPAHFCGVAGLKPTSGRVPRTGHTPGPGGPSDGLWQAGPMAHRVEDLALALPLLAGPDPSDPETVPVPLRDPKAVELADLRVATYADNGIYPATPEVRQAVKACAERLRKAGANVQEARPENLGETWKILVHLFAGDGGAGVLRALEKAGTRTPSEPLRTWLKLVQIPMTAPEFSHWRYRWFRFRQHLSAFLQDWDVILCPPCALPAPPHGHLAWTSPEAAACGYAATWNLAGWPAGVLPVAKTATGLPLGVQVVAGPWREDRVLAVMAALEDSFGAQQEPEGGKHN